jgi:hypothetical protein
VVSDVHGRLTNRVIIVDGLQRVSTDCSFSGVSGFRLALIVFQEVAISTESTLIGILPVALLTLSCALEGVEASELHCKEQKDEHKLLIPPDPSKSGFEF